MKQPIFFLNGNFLSADQAQVSVTDLAVQRGYGVFETLRTYRGKPFRLEGHLARLYQSARLMEIRIPYAIDSLKQKVGKTLAQNSYPESMIKIIITGGESEDTIAPKDKAGVCILVTKLHLYPTANYEKGVSLISFPYQRFLPAVKNLDYSTAVLAQLRARKKGASEALYITPDKFILECTTSNFFLIRKGEISTSPKDSVLSGITRQEAIEIARSLKLPCKETEIKLADLKEADEAFVTSSVREIMPVVRVDDIKIGKGKPGAITQKILTEFRKRAQAL